MMKKIITSAALILSSALAFGQDNYTIKMNTKVDGLPAEYASFGEQETVTYIKGDKTKTEVSNMMMNQTRLYDGKIHTFLMESMGDKYGYTATNEELEAGSKNEKSEKPKVEYTSEKKNIAGYECTKAIITTVDKDKKENKMTVWVTDKINFDLSKVKKGAKGDMMDMGDLKGYPLAMEMSRTQGEMNMKITITATEVSTKPVDDAVFKVNTDGYKMMTYKEAREKMKATGGGR